MAWLVIGMIVLIFVVILQIAKASEYVGILKGEKNAQLQSNKINGFLMLVFLVLGLLAVWYCHRLLAGKTLGESASIEGEEIDRMMLWTLYITGFVCVLTQILLFYFAWKYQYKETNKVYYFYHSTKLELIWTTIPAVAMTFLVVFGLIHWTKITDDAPKNALHWEITGKQFNWLYRHPGADESFGKKDRYKITSTNAIGVDFADQAAMDDVMVTDAIHCVKGRPIELTINSRDVIHDVGLVHFRMKMDAVPGIPTKLWFTPKFSTAEMKIKEGSKFEYEISCDQMCGSNHYAMRGIVFVHETQEEYDAWLAKQSTLYATENPVKKVDAPAANVTLPKTEAPQVAKPVVPSPGKVDTAKKPLAKANVISAPMALVAKN
jgi:cytochrome c oxidase subunit II